MHVEIEHQMHESGLASSVKEGQISTKGIEVICENSTSTRCPATVNKDFHYSDGSWCRIFQELSATFI